MFSLAMLTTVVIFFICSSFFFFSSRRRHTRYWRDWSSDVCSSDLHNQSRPRRYPKDGFSQSNRQKNAGRSAKQAAREPQQCRFGKEQSQHAPRRSADRSEERRVGKECRSRWTPYDTKNKKK